MKQVIEQGFSVVDVSTRIGIPTHILASSQAWVTDISYIRTYEGWLFLAVVMDLYSRQVVGWGTAPMMTRDLVLQAFLEAHHMVPSTSRRGNCHDDAVAESFSSALKKERIKRRIYPNRTTATSDVFDYIKMFYNPIRRHGSAGGMAPIELERRNAQRGD